MTYYGELVDKDPMMAHSFQRQSRIKIIKLLGTPSKESIQDMNPNYTEFKFPTIKAHPWSKVFKKNTPASAIFGGTSFSFKDKLWCGLPKICLLSQEILNTSVYLIFFSS